MEMTKTIYLRSLILSLLWISVVSTDATVINGINYSLDSDKKEAAVISNSPGYSGDIVIPEEVEYSGTLYSVTSIGNRAFFCCYGMTSVTIPNSVTSIGSEAFDGCYGMTSVTIPNSVTSIGTGAFRGCGGLTSIDIPNSVTSIGNQAFFCCYGMTSVTIPNSVTSIGSEAFDGCHVTSVTIPNSVTSIGTGAFRGCPSLTSLNVEAGNTKYDSRDNCNAIIETATNTLIKGTRNTIIPNSVTSIDGYAFWSCIGMPSVTIPNSVTSIGTGAFGACDDLTSLKVEAGNTKYDSRDNCNAIIETATNTLISGTKNTIIPNSVTSIGDWAFQSCWGLTSITIPNSVTSIGDDAFSSCSGLTSITIPNSVTSIGDRAFHMCSSLTSVTVEAKTPPTIAIAANVFSNSSSATLYVPVGSKATYEAADYWKEFGTILESSEGQTSKTIYVETAGTLPSLISDDEKYTIEELTLTGELNGTDFRLLRDMSGNNYLGQKTEGKLRILDLSGASIVAGGDMFLDTDILSSDDHTMGGPFHYYIEKDNVWPNYIVTLCKFEKIILPNNLSEIDFWAFRDCLSLEEIIIPKSVVKIDDLNGTENPFQSCPKLKKIIVDGDNENYTTIDGVLFDKSVSQLICYPSDKSDESYVVPKSVKEIDAVAFVKCKATSIVIPEGVERLKRYTFYSSENLETISLPNSLTVIDDLCFNLCTSLRNISLPSKLRTISDGAFFYCLSLTSIVIPSTVESIAIGAFSYCNSMASISVEAGNNVYDSRNNCNAIIEKESNRLIVGCSSTLIPNDVLNICNGSFTGNLGLTSISIPNSVLEIGSNAFSECRNLASVELPNSINVIGSHAFAFTSLSSVSIPENVTCISDYTFGSCTKLESVKLPNNLSEIQADAFNSCWKLKLIEIPSSVSAIGEKAFYACKGLSTVISNIKVPFAINENVFSNRANAALYVPVGSKAAYEAADYWKDFKEIKEIQEGNIVFADANVKAICVANWDKDNDGELSIEEAAAVTDLGKVFQANETITSFDELRYFTGLTSIMGGFSGCKGLTSIEIPNSITSIGHMAFYGCSGLTSVTIPNSVTYINDLAFSSCSGLTSINVDANNSKYDSRENCNAIIETATNTLIAGSKSTVIPNSVTSIGNHAFNSCSGLTSITIPNSVTSIGSDAFSCCSSLTSIIIPNSVTSIGESAFFVCSGLTSITIPNSVTSIANSVFSGCSGLTSVTIPNSVTSIGEWAFFMCSSLTSIEIPNSVTSIGNNAFSCCSGLTSITIPNCVTSIGSWAFSNCSSLTSVTVEAKTPITILENVFTNRANATLYVPAGTKAAYEGKDYWKEFKTILDLSVRTIDVATAGSLSDLISNDDVDPLTITDLTITGQLNGDDLALLRAMAGNDMKGKPTEGKLSKLDISGATIMAGGTYLDLDNQFIDLGNNYQLNVYGDKHLTSVANTFGDYLFAGCQQLKSVKTPTRLVKIDNYVFERSGLTSIDLNSGLTTLDPYAFWESKLSSITIPKTVTHIGDKNSVDNPFAYINELTSITLEAGNTRYTMTADGKLLIDTQRKAVVTALGNAEIPEGITWIGQNAFCNQPEMVHYTIPNWVTQIGDNSFSQCINLKSVVISNQMTTIANSAFTDCPNLTSVTIPSSVTKIMYNAFGNTGLTEITIPSSVTSIDEEAFAHNQNLETVISYITDPFDINDDVFAKGWDLSNTTYPQTLKVPYGTKDLYKAKTGWNKIANIVEMAQASTITITAKSSSRAYGEANPTFGYDISGGTVTGTPTITCEATATSYIGTYPIVITAGTISDPLTKYVNGTLTITKAPLKITAGSYKKKQGEANPAFSVTYDGFKNNETASVLTTQPTIYCAATESSPAGTYEIVVSGAFADNYEISYVAGTLTIEAIPTPEPTPEPKGTTFEEDMDNSSSKEVKVTFVVNEGGSSGTPTVAISDDKDASGSISIPETVTHNGIEYKVTEIGTGAFQNNTGLTEVTIPSSIVSIGANAFAGCTNLQSITINIIVPINLYTAAARAYVRALTRSSGDDVFDGVNKNTCILYGPEGSVDAYRAAPVWKEFKNILPIKTATEIKGIEQTDGEPFDVFNLSGQKVKSKTTSLDGLPRGIYIINGKKVMK